MRKIRIFGWVGICLILMTGLFYCAPAGGDAGIEEEGHMKRIGMVIGIDPERIEEYRKLHADDYAGVRDLLNKYHMHNFSIFIKQFDDGKWYLFGYYEYTGENYEADMAALDKEPRNIEWLSVTDSTQIPFEGENSWSMMERVYFNR